MTRSLAVALLALALAAIAPQSALAAVSVSRAEFSSGSLRIEGSATANRSITVDGVAMTTSTSTGAFRVQRSSFTAPADCTVDVNDGSATAAVARLSGCTAVAPPASTSNTFAPNVAELPANVGARFSETFTFGPNVIGPVRWEVVAGALPAGLSITIPATGGRPIPPAQQNFMRIVGTPTTVQTSTFTLRATDTNGVTGTRAYTIRVGPALPLSITPHAWDLVAEGSPANLFLDGNGGVLPYAWSVPAGALPPGMAVVQDDPSVGLVRVGGTPTASGTFNFTLRLTDAQGTVFDRALTVNVAPTIVPTLNEVAVTPSVTGGSSPIATVRITPPAPAGGVTVALSSSNTSAATVPASVFLPAGETVGAFTVSTSPVTATATTTLSATLAAVTRTATLTVNPPASSPPPATTNPDAVTITRAEYDAAKRQLRVEAASSRTGATLRVHVTSTGALVGTLSGGAGQFSLDANPQSITVRSSLGGSATRTVTAK